MWFRPNKYEAFEQWCDAVKVQKAESTFNLAEHAKGAQGTNEKKLTSFANEVRDRIQDGKLSSHSISINAGFAHQEKFYLNLSKQSPDLQIHEDSKLHVFSINTQELGACKLNSVITNRLIIGERTTFLALDHCRVRSLHLLKGKATNVEIRGSWIGYLELESGAIHDMLIEGGTIRSVRCPPPDEGNPFTGHVHFHNDVDFRTDLMFGFHEGAQPYTNLRVHLEELQNATMAGLVRALELRTERHTDRGFNKFWNYAWGWCANYGYSPGRPLWFILVFYLATALGLWIWDGGALSQDLNQYEGWEGWFTHHDWFRAVYLPLRPIISPLGALGGGSLVVAATLGGKLALVLQGIATYLLIGMTVIGVRKRFKLH